MSDARDFRNQSFLLIGLPVLSILLLGSGLFLNIRIALSAQKQEERAHNAQIAADLLLKNFLDQETGVRGYLLQHDPAFLEPYNEAHKVVDQRLMNLSQLLDDNPVQHERLNEIDRIYQEWESRTTVVLSSGASQSMRNDYDVAGKRLMDALRHKMQQFTAAERLSEAALQQSRTNARTIAYGLLFALLILSGAAFAIAAARTWRKLAQAFEQKIAEIEKLATHDELTGLPNRHYVEQKLQPLVNQARLSNEPVALFHLDIDRFKQVNESFGSRAADEVLRLTADRLRASFHPDSMLARISGDEFVAVIPGVEAEHLEKMAQELMAAAMQPARVDHVEVPVSMSAGVALHSGSGIDSELLRRHAAQALQVAKQEGGAGHRLYDESVELLYRRKSRITDHLREALNRDEGLSIAYQPICATDGTLHGFESLLRFQHHEDGAISPSEFIPAAEESGLIVPLGAWVLNRLSRQITSWNRDGLAVPFVSLNISPIQLLQPNFASTVADEFPLATHQPGKMVLELTESTIMSNLGAARAQMRQLHAYGFRIAVDDFGTGYSSLSYLHELEVDTLKIDASFVRRMGQSRESAVVVRAIIELAHALEMRVVAEGVESEEQLRILKHMGCPLIQGYLFARPMSAEEARTLLTRS